MLKLLQTYIIKQSFSTSEVRVLEGDKVIILERIDDSTRYKALRLKDDERTEIVIYEQEVHGYPAAAGPAQLRRAAVWDYPRPSSAGGDASLAELTREFNRIVNDMPSDYIQRWSVNPFETCVSREADE